MSPTVSSLLLRSAVDYADDFGRAFDGEFEALRCAVVATILAVNGVYADMLQVLTVGFPLGVVACCSEFYGVAGCFFAVYGCKVCPSPLR